MNKNIRDLMIKSGYAAPELAGRANKFSELLLEEVRNLIAEEYRKTPLESCGHFLNLDEKIVETFYKKGD